MSVALLCNSSGYQARSLYFAATSGAYPVEETDNKAANCPKTQFAYRLTQRPEFAYKIDWSHPLAVRL